MAILQDLSLGDSAFATLAVVVLGVAVLSTAAWLVSLGLRRNPAVRHLILLWAILGCMGMPALACLAQSLGLTVLAIPLFAAVPSTPGPHIAPAGQHAPAGAPPASTGLTTLRESARRDDSGLVRTSEPASWPLARSSRAAAPAANPIARSLPVPTLGARTFTGSYRDVATCLLLIWAAGSLLLLARLARCCALVARLRRSSAPVTDRSLVRLMASLDAARSPSRPPRLRISRAIATPLAAGFWDPAIILPERLLGAVTDDELRDILLHELAHVRRRDPQAVLVQELARALFWPIVTIHLALSELARAREELCDNHVLQSRDALSYGQTLLHLAELSLQARLTPAAVGILQWRGELERRIAGFLDQGRSTMTRTDRWLKGLVAMAFLVVGLLTAATRLVTATERPATAPGSARVVEPAPDARPEDPPKRTMKVLVLGPDGNPMPGVRIHRSVWTRKPGVRGNLDVVTDEEGQVELEVPEGIYIWRLWARADGHVPLFAHWEEAENPERNLPAEFTFRLDRGTTIGGMVQDQDGKPIRGVAVEAMLSRGGEGDGRTGPDTWLAEGSAAARTDAEGRWMLDNVPPGLNLDIKLRLTHPDYISDTGWGTLQQEQAISLKDLRTRKATMTMRGGLIATGTVTDPQGKPVTGAVVVRGDRPYWETGSQEVLTDDHGRFKFPPLPAGAINITVIAQGWMPAIRKVEIKKGMSPFDFRLEPGKTLKLRFVDATGEPVPGVGVLIDTWRGRESLYNHRHPNVLDTKIPNRADDEGRYVWDWAPNDAVSYRFFKEGMAEQKAEFFPHSDERTLVLPQVLRITGKVTDAATGQPIPRFAAMPVIEYEGGRLDTGRNNVKNFTDGSFTIQTDHGNSSTRVRIEVDGYRSVVSEAIRPGTPNPSLDLRLEPAAPLQGRILDLEGKPVKDARVYLATRSQVVFSPDQDQGMHNQRFLTGEDGSFVFPAQCERFAIVAMQGTGHVEVAGDPDRQPGDLRLRSWAKIQGTVLQGGKPVPGVWVSFEPLRLLGGDRPHVQDDLSVQTDRDGRYVFPRVPPVKGSVQAHLSVFRESPLTSSQSVPLDLQPGQTADVVLGGKGTVVKGRVLLTGDAASAIDLSKSLNWLLRRAPGIEPPAEIRSAGFTAEHGWNNAWTTSQEGYAFLRTLHTHFVVLDKEGRFAIHGVPAGDYDLALRLYEPPGQGCLVNPVGSRVVRIRVGEQDAAKDSLDVGDIAVHVALGPRVGDPAPELTLTSFNTDGPPITLGSLRGRYVLLDFWATWCAPCVSDLPALAKLHETYKRNDRFTLLGVNLDDDPSSVRPILERARANWTQGRLGTNRSERDEVLTRYAISSVPCYILIGPDGRIVHRGETLEEAEKAMRRLVR